MSISNLPLESRVDTAVKLLDILAETIRRGQANATVLEDDAKMIRFILAGCEQSEGG